MAQPSNPVPAMTTTPIPLERPVVVIGPQYLAQYPVDLIISTKIFTFGENDFSIKDVNGALIFKIKSKFMSIHDRRFLKDAAGNTIVNLRQKIRTAHRRWEAFRGESTDEKDLLFSVRKSSLFQMKTQLDVFLAGNKSEEVPDFKIKGGWMESSCTIFLGDGNSKTIIAQMHRGHNLQTALLDTENFAVTTYPNVDYAFIMALVVVLDEINNDRSGVD
ncbi:protein LURP-one-related 15-like [Euphorbia lathyris]|uniref:protein LURP-one-related 15-like n=1 Tax=Euphorbia lathyris TaxID=212925 RepID=UPI003314197C